MSQFEQEHIEVETFDREYGIEELLPLEVIDRLGTRSAAILPSQWAILTEKGRVHYHIGAWPPDQLDRIAKQIIETPPEDEFLLEQSDGCCIELYPITYEMEIIGYLAVCGPRHAEHRQWQTGRAGVNLFKQLMRLTHRTMLTSGLHGLVVEESYAELKEKAAQLAVSEEKYRHLAANLEIEVQKKTEEIRTAHAHMMQQEKMAAIGQLSAGMAHEINNPLGFIHSNLTSLKSYAEDLTTLMQHYRLLAERCNTPDLGELPESVKRQCKAIEKCEQRLDGTFLLDDIPLLVDESLAGAQRIEKIVKDLKAVARPGETEKERINIHESLGAVLTIVQNRIGPEITVCKNFGQPPQIYGFPQEISQIWLNLILNALDALGDQGTLTIETGTDRGQVVVAIGDTGTGIAQSDLSKIYDPFYTTKEVGRGTGLGLHLVYHLITQHSGRIDVQSTVGQGTIFTVHLPIEQG